MAKKNQEGCGCTCLVLGGLAYVIASQRDEDGLGDALGGIGVCISIWLIYRLIYRIYRSFKARSLRKKIRSKVLSLRKELIRVGDALSKCIERNFIVEPCSRCLESQMLYEDLSPNARSVQYACASCGKKRRAAAGNKQAEEALDLKTQFDATISELGLLCGNDVSVTVPFSTAESPLPYEQTTREPIREAVRSEVWRRDGGQCVKCGSKQNLQFDHIIPVSKGGATTVRNLQLLCGACNGAKGSKI